MRIKIIVALLLGILAIFNYSIYEKEQIKADGQTLLLELTPRDPRALLQGDYMRLYYALERQIFTQGLLSFGQTRGYLVVRPDAANVAQFVRFYNKKHALAEDEKLLRFHGQYGQVRIVPNTFFFQEGHAKYYENAKYGVFKFKGADTYLLLGLAGEDGEVITPE